MVASALFLDPSSPTALAAQSTICGCSCASEIRNIYGGILWQWSLLNDEISPSIAVLSSFCKADYIRSISASISESTSVQCATNYLSVALAVTSSNSVVPSGSVITLVGLNADVPPNGVQVSLSPPTLLQSFAWSQASCSQYCIPNKPCASSPSCNNAVPNANQRPSQCLQWCDEDAILTIIVNQSFQETTILITVNNPCLGARFAPEISVAISGQRFYAPPTAVKQPNPLVLMSSVAPSFKNFQVNQDVSDQFDPQYQVWRGSALGQRNTLIFSFTPNVDVYSGTNITISGLFYSLYQNSSSPTIRQLPSLFTSLVVDSWFPGSGTIYLRISSNLTGPVFIAGQLLSFGLEVTMPLTSASALKASPNLTIGASGLGPRRACCCTVAWFTVATQVLVPKSTSIPFFAMSSIGQSTCFPGECNTISLTIAVNTAVNSPSNVFLLVITGLEGMDLSSNCGTSCNTGKSVLVLGDVTPGSYLI